MKLTAFLLMLLLTLPGLTFLHAQTAAEMDAILASPAVSCEEAARFVLQASGTIPPADVSAAFARARQNKYLGVKAQANTPIKLGELAHLIIKAFSLKGNFMYRIFPGPRYAFRELAFRRLIPQGADPADNISGSGFLHILGNVLSAVGAEEAEASPQVINVPVETPPPPAESAEPAEPVSGSIPDVQGVSAGSEGVEQYKGEFEIE